MLPAGFAARALLPDDGVGAPLLRGVGCGSASDTLLPPSAFVLDEDVPALDGCVLLPLLRLFFCVSGAGPSASLPPLPPARALASRQRFSKCSFMTADDVMPSVPQKGQACGPLRRFSSAHLAQTLTHGAARGH